MKEKLNASREKNPRIREKFAMINISEKQRHHNVITSRRELEKTLENYSVCHKRRRILTVNRRNLFLCIRLLEKVHHTTDKE